MTPKKQQVIYDAFPDLFRKGMDNSGLMQYGLCVGDGWFRLLCDLAEAITEECKRLGLKPGKPGYPVAVQVKEKFGELRFYIEAIPFPSPRYSDDEIDNLRRGGEGPGLKKMERYERLKQELVKLDSVYALTSEANKLSRTICERCGSKGELRQRGTVVQMRCDKCAGEEEREEEEQRGR